MEQASKQEPVEIPLKDTHGRSAGVHKHRKNRSDPFLDLDIDSDKSPSVSGPSEAEAEAGGYSHGLTTDLILTPLNLITFVVSLSLIDFRQRQWRLSQHASNHESFWFRIMHFSWLNPEPYQDSRDGTWKHNDKGIPQQPSNMAFQGWSTQKKHRAVTKMEISDAFEMRGRVLVALLAWAVIVVFALAFIAKRLHGWMNA